MARADIRQWHRLFGIALTDLFRDTPWRVELEMELALTSQLLDVVIIERADGAQAERARAEREPALGTSGTAPDLPDGLEALRAHNLLTYKSQHEALTGWALDELVGHYVNYRKLVGPKDRLVPEASFGLYAVSVRLPRDLAPRLQPAGVPGVFDLPWGTHQIRVVVLGEIERHPRNAAWDLFSARADRIRDGARHYRARRPGVVELLSRLYLAYVLELPDMPYTMEEFIRETHQEFLKNLTPDERQAFLDQLPAEDRLRGLASEDILRSLTPDSLRKLKDHLNKLN